MKNRYLAIVLECIPIVSLVITFSLIFSEYNSVFIKNICTITMIIAFLGFIFYFIGKFFSKDNKTVFILGILDIITTVTVIGFYILVSFLVGL